MLPRFKAPTLSISLKLTLLLQFYSEHYPKFIKKKTKTTHNKPTLIFLDDMQTISNKNIHIKCK